jgi:hypothetical protein
MHRTSIHTRISLKSLSSKNSRRNLSSAASLLLLSHTDLSPDRSPFMPKRPNSSNDRAHMPLRHACTDQARPHTCLIKRINETKSANETESILNSLTTTTHVPCVSSYPCTYHTCIIAPSPNMPMHHALHASAGPTPTMSSCNLHRTLAQYHPGRTDQDQHHTVARTSHRVVTFTYIVLLAWTSRMTSLTDRTSVPPWT